jgi:hypothetical protein
MTRMSMKFRRPPRWYSKFGSITSLTESELSLDLYHYLRDLQATVSDCAKKSGSNATPTDSQGSSVIGFSHN